MPVLAAVLFVAACGEDGGPAGTPVSSTARVRFVNATTGMTGSGGFTTNGQFATGSALALGQSTQTCAQVNAGSTSFGFGAANAGGTGLSGNALATLNNQSITVGNRFTVAATGSATNPTLFLIDDNVPAAPGANQTSVRFVNLAPGTGTPANNFTILKGVLGQGHSLIEPNIVVGAPTPFGTMTSGSNTFTILKAHETVISGSAATLTLQAGTVNTIAIVPTTTPGGFQLINVPRC